MGSATEVSFTNSTISNNSAASGAGIDNRNGVLRVTNSTVFGDSASSAGGGLRSAAVGGSMLLVRALISGNAAPSGPEIFVAQPELGAVQAYNFNLFGHDDDAGMSDFSPGATDIVPSQSLSAILSTTLANNGNPTQTHELFTGSPAVDAATDGACPPPAVDQRDNPRPQNGNQDGEARATSALSTLPQL